jgi:hypothetical protein
MALTKVSSAMQEGPLFNYAQNAEFRFFRRQVPGTLTSFQDTAYGPDRWKILNSGGAVNTQVARVAEVISSSPTPYVCQVRQADATARQFGIAQVLEYDRVVSLRGKTVSFNFWARTDTTEVSNIRAAIIEWTGTADSVTADIVSSWSSTPTLVASCTAINTPADLALTGTMQQFNISATLGSSFNNLVLFVWSTATEAQNDDFYITQMQLIEGAAPAAWSTVRKTFGQDEHEVTRFFQKTYAPDVAPATNTGTDSEGAWVWRVVNPSSTGVWRVMVHFPTIMRGSPGVTFYSTDGTSARLRDRTNAANASSIGANHVTSKSMGIEFSSTVATTSTFFEGHYALDAEL